MTDTATIERLRAFDPFAPRVDAAAASAVAPGDGRLGILLLDVFTDAPLRGNPLAVVTDARGLTAETMQRIARELNLSETVFALPPEHGGDVRIRIFTPAKEMPFAGHPTLGAAIVTGVALARPEVTVETAAGPVTVSLAAGHGRVAGGTMSQPLPTVEPYAQAAALLIALGVTESRLPVELYCNGPRHVLVALGDEHELECLRPDLRAVAELGELLVSCFAGAGTDWTTRMFAPALGVAEDPATGSAAGPLAVHLARHGQTRFGESLAIRQGAAIGRPSLLVAAAHGRDGQLERVEVSGDAVFVARAEMRL
jgi:trans-2,3-dihydro-3-hydroxyanthranilate isomerase